MSKSEILYNEIAKKISSKNKNAEASQMFGKPCLKINGKAFACFFNDDMVFKLTGDAHEQALSLKGSKLFDPSAKGMQMKEWVQVKLAHCKEWNKLADAALKYVSTAAKKK